MLLVLPEDAWSCIALNLPAPDILSFLSSHRSINDALGKSPALWKRLLLRDSMDDSEERHGSYELIRKEYMVKAYMSHIPSVKWYPLLRWLRMGISPREGHLSCVLTGPDMQKRICIQGGFADDTSVYVINVPSKRNLAVAGASNAWVRNRLQPQSDTSFVYGASFTALPPVIEDGCHVSRAVRFGGFESGGYSNETNQVWLMTLKDEQSKEGGENRLTASWEMVPTTHPQFAAPRAYHSATLLGDRYLVVLGGMMWRQSIVAEAILDTQTWTWFDQQISAHGGEKPSGRHGHSVILDSKRNRLLLFGGGSGTDLLRSGQDNSEVWELKMNDDWETTLRLPWTWSKIHNDSLETEVNDSSMEGEKSSNAQLSPAESLCLGRCHHGIKISPDTALFLYGSGRPSTNHVIGYDLHADEFLRPNISGVLPKPRFSGVASFLETEGYIFCHGGYTSQGPQGGESIDEMSVLDLAPFLQRTFDGHLPIDSRRRSFREITNEEADRAGAHGFHHGNSLESHNFMAQILSMTRGGLVNVDDLETLLAINNGTVRIGNDGILMVEESQQDDSEEEDGDDDSDYQDSNEH